MTDSRRIYTGADYAPAALVVFGIVFSPALLFLSGPIGDLRAAFPRRAWLSLGSAGLASRPCRSRP
jgi:hypothetical protein